MAEDGAGRTVCVYLENACGHLLAFSDELITVARELKKRYGFTISGLALCSGNALKNLLREVQQLSFERIDIYLSLIHISICALLMAERNMLCFMNFKFLFTIPILYDKISKYYALLSAAG